MTIELENKTQENPKLEYVPIEEPEPQHELAIRLAVAGELLAILEAKLKASGELKGLIL